MESSFVAKGWLFIAIGVAVNTLYIYILRSIRADLEYSPDNADLYGWRGDLIIVHK